MGFTTDIKGQRTLPPKPQLFMPDLRNNAGGPKESSQAGDTCHVQTKGEYMRVLSAGIVLAAAGISSQAYALVDGQLNIGQRTATESFTDTSLEEQSVDIKSTDVGLSVHFNPLMMPVAFGLFGTMSNFDRTEIVEQAYDGATGSLSTGEPISFTADDGSLKGLTYGPEILAWIPGLPLVKPMLRVSMPIGTYTRTTGLGYKVASTDIDIEETVVYSSSGLLYAIGLQYSPIPLIGVIVEYQMGNEKLKAKSVKYKAAATVGSTSITEESDGDVDDDLEDEERNPTMGSKAIRLGVSFSM